MTTKARLKELLQWQHALEKSCSGGSSNLGHMLTGNTLSTTHKAVDLHKQVLHELQQEARDILTPQNYHTEDTMSRGPYCIAPPTTERTSRPAQLLLLDLSS